MTQPTLKLPDSASLARQNDKFQSQGHVAFHPSLTAQDPAIGYKDVEWMIGQLTASGLSKINIHPMPATNLVLAAVKV